MPPVTRSESQAQTREQLIATATTLFLRDGYQATSLNRVAHEAGFSTGAVYSNFANKGRLALIVLERIETEQLTALRKSLTVAADAPAKIAAIDHWADAGLRSGWPKLELEFALAVSQDEQLAGHFTDRERGARDAVAIMLDEQLDALGFGAPLPTREIARTAVTLGIGLAVQSIFDPRVSAEGLFEQLATIMEAGITATGGAQQKTPERRSRTRQPRSDDREGPSSPADEGSRNGS